MQKHILVGIYLMLDKASTVNVLHYIEYVLVSEVLCHLAFL